MENEILAKLRTILAKLYPDEASMRRISHDAGLDLTRVTLNSSAINNWHSILSEAEKLDRVDALLAVVEHEYGSNQAFLDAYTAYRRFVGRDQINFIVPLGSWEKVRRLLFKGQGRAAAVKALQTEFQSFDWAKAEQAYLDKVIKLYDRVRILGNSTDVPLGDIFTQVYILDKPTARYRHDIEELRKQGFNRLDFQRQPGERMHGLDLVQQGQNLFILGKPGAGKTTFLKYITIQAAHKQLPRVPIFVSLNQWADSRWGKGDKAALLPFLVEQFDICDFPDAALFIDYLLRAGRALVSFDGLDEVKQEKDQRRRLTHLLQDFARKYDKAQHLITCRIAASDYVFAGFADVEVADFTWDQVHEYARKWFSAQDKKFAAFTAELDKSENQGLGELCKTPLLLALLCLTFDNNLRFPPSRAELYEDALEILLRKWDSSRAIQRDEIYRALSYKRKLQLLMCIAVPTFEKSELFFRQRELEQWIVNYLVTLPDAPLADSLDGTVLLKSIEAQHGILIERAQGIYSFSHLTLQEYLTARYLAENQGRGITNKLIHNHLTDQRWREVFLLTASLLGDGDEFTNAVRGAVDHIITDSPILYDLFTWAHTQCGHAHMPVEHRVAVQLAYIFLARARDFARSPDLASSVADAFTYNRKLGSDLARAYAINLATARENDHTLICNLAYALNSEFAGVLTSKFWYLSYALDHARTFIDRLAHATTLQVGLDYGLYYAWSYATIFASQYLKRTDKHGQAAMQKLPYLLHDIVTQAEMAGLTTLAQQLAAHSVPLSNAHIQAWRQYAAFLFTIMCEQRDLGREWNFSQEDLDKLNNYLYANELLVQCLKVATVSDREAVLQGLLLPPAGGQDDKKTG